MLGTILLKILLLLFFLLLALTVVQLFSNYRQHQMKEIAFEPVQPKYWPTKKWQHSTPEQQGISSAKLLEMIVFYENYQKKHPEAYIDSITIIRQEQIIGNFYFNPLFPKGEKHIINSCAKSIVGILIGIAIDKGFIKDVQVPILDFFEEENLENTEERLASMTLEHLLTMRTGWHSQDSYLYQWKGLFKMQATENWVGHILNLPFEAKPDARFDYSNMASFLLSAIITKASGMDTLSFAKKYLFSPLGIRDIHWDKSPKGIYMGFARMWLQPDAMAKFGMLMLQKGQWENQQIVSQVWVEASIKAHSFPKQYRYIHNQENKIDFSASGGNWVFSNLVRPFTDGYGYQWWLDKSGMFTALGVGGQYIMVVPKEQLIVVATSKLKGKDTFLPVKLMKKFILPAIESKYSIPANEKSYQFFKAYSNPPSLQLKINSDFKLPPIAWTISGTTYKVEDSIVSNPWQYNNFCLNFEKKESHALIHYTTVNNEKIQYKVGLDNQYHITNFNGKKYAAKGVWTNQNTFAIDLEIIGYSAKSKWLLIFKEDKIEVIEIGMTGNNMYKGKLIE